MATIKQQEAVKELVGNGGNVTKAMRKAKYSENTINTPQKLTESKGWKELMEQHLPDDVLAKVHREGLEAGKRIFKNNNKSGEIEDIGIEPDFPTRHKYLDSAYKLKGMYAPEKSLTLNVTTKIDDPKTLELVNEYEEKIKRTL